MQAKENEDGIAKDGDTILVDHSDGRTFFAKVEADK